MHLIVTLGVMDTLDTVLSGEIIVTQASTVRDCHESGSAALSRVISGVFSKRDG